MTDIEIRTFRHGIFSSDLAGVVNLYNQSLSEFYGFFPLSVDKFVKRVQKSPEFRPDLFSLAVEKGKIIGMAHAAIIRDVDYNKSGVVELIAVHPAYRRQGIGGKLLAASLQVLKQRKVKVIDGGGAFPFTPFYTTLLDGSERSGVEINNKAALALFTAYGFKQGQESFIMRADLGLAQPQLSVRLAELGKSVHFTSGERECGNSWFDYVFRDWQLYETKTVAGKNGKVLSRAIFSFMPELSKREGRKLYSVFAVNTSVQLRRQGWATLHFAALREEIAARGGEVLELHVYADNIPALKLYTRSGFVIVGKTVMLRWYA